MNESGLNELPYTGNHQEVPPPVAEGIHGVFTTAVAEATSFQDLETAIRSFYAAGGVVEGSVQQYEESELINLVTNADTPLIKVTSRYNLRTVVEKLRSLEEKPSIDDWIVEHLQVKTFSQVRERVRLLKEHLKHVSTPECDYTSYIERLDRWEAEMNRLKDNMDNGRNLFSPEPTIQKYFFSLSQ